MKNYFLTFIAGLIFPFGFAPFDIWPLTIISLSIFLYILERRLSRNSFLLGFVYGLGLWSLGVSWVYVSIHYHGNQGILSSLLITILFIFFLSLYTGLTSYLI